MAIVTTDQNIKFNSVLDDVVVLSTDGTTSTVVLWDNLPPADQSLLTTIVNDLGGTAPLAAPVAGFATVNLGGAAVGGDATGLNPLAAATFGTATVDLGAAKAGGDPSGLIVTGTATAGYQTVTITPAFANGAAATGLANTVPATAGKAYATFNVVMAGTDTATLPGSAGTYYFKVAVDGAAAVEYSIVTAGVNQSFNTIANLLDGAAGLDAAGVDVTYDAVGGRFVFTRKTTGATSTVVVTAGTTGTDIFEQIVTDVAPTSVTRTTVGGTAATNTTYTATITVDGVAKSISLTGNNAQTVTTLLAEINTDLGASAIASLVSGNIKVTSATTGATSTVAIVDGTLFAALTGTATIGTAHDGVAATGTNKPYSAIVEVNGVAHNVTFTGAAGDTVAHVVSEIAADLAGFATVALTGGDIVITSTVAAGTKSKVRVFDTGWLFASMTGYTKVTYVDGVAPTVYTTTVAVDGVDVPVSVQGSDALTVATLVTAVDTALTAVADAALTNGNIVITSKTTGATSSVQVKGDRLFGAVTGFKGFKSVVGAADLVDVLHTIRMPNGTTGWNYFPHVTVGAKPANPVPGVVPKTVDYIYWGGTPADWRYFNDNTVV